MGSLKTEFKKTGISWISEIPMHWEISRLGNYFNERIEIVNDTEYPPLSVTMKGIVPQLDHVAKTDHNENRKKVLINDFVINSRSDRKGSGGISNHDGSVTIISTVLKPNDHFYSEYTNYLLTNKNFQEEFYRNGKGIVDDMWSTKFRDMKNIRIPVPPTDEQKKIADFIKTKSEKINSFIQKKQLFIKLLKEQRQSIINHAVTKGSNPDVKMRDSGIEWLGQVPEHWGIRKLKFCVTQNSNDLNLEGIDRNVFKVALENIDKWTGKYIKSESSLFEGEGKYFKKGDVLFNKLRPYLAKAYIPDTEGICVGEFLVFTPNKEILESQFLFQRLMTTEFIEIVNSSTYGSKMPRANWDFIGNLKIAIPPLDEQKQIVEHIKLETKTMDIAISKAEREIELMKEYKEALIAEAVIGKTLKA